MGETASVEMRSPASAAESSEERFYSSYSWCLNPVLSLRELLHRLREELSRFERLQAGWQREESRINVYLFICAIACTVDDYLAWHPWDLSRIGAHFPRLRRVATLAEWLLNLPHSLRSLVRDRRILHWRRSWDRCVDEICGVLARQELPEGSSHRDVEAWASLAMTVQSLAGAGLPARLLERRMRLPEAFRCQDLTHHDVFSLGQRFVASRQKSKKRVVVVLGVRTAGAYFAPLIKAYLSMLGWPRVSWFTIRPKAGLPRWERHQLRGLRNEDAEVLVVDDYPNTGLTLVLTVGALRQFGVRNERITILVPRHQSRPDWTLPGDEGRTEGVTLITLEPGELYKAALLDPRSAEPLLRDYYRDFQDARIEESGRVDEINARLWRHYEDGFHVRLKRVFQVRLGACGHEPVLERILAKSVGWGWLGYHAYIIGSRLAGSVPRLIGLRNGLMITEWRSETGRNNGGMTDRNRVRVLSSYLVKRVRRLPLAEDPCFDSPDYRWTGWDEIVNILRGVYGPYAGRLKVRALRGHLRRYVSPMPALVDGRMGPDEWVEDASGVYKVDFEQHNFGGAELDIVDPASDLASATFEFSLSEREERELLEAYASESGDRTIADRILLYHLLHGVLTMKRALGAIGPRLSPEKQEQRHRRYLSARNFLVYRMNRFSASLIRRPPAARWSKRLFFLDLDWVFDRELLGFPHTTFSGLAALELLRSHGFSVVLNTGRSVDHVRNYCETYMLPGGLAEYGSVFVDSVHRREMELGDAEAAEQLLRCRDALATMPGVFTDPGYRYSVRAYRCADGRTVCLPPAEMEKVLAGCGCDRLTFIAKPETTYVIGKGRGKGTGLLAVKRYLHCTEDPVVAMGDSDQDLEALEAADIAYAPSNCSAMVRELAGREKCRVMRHPFQRGLLAAARDLLRDGAFSDNRDLLEPDGPSNPGDLLAALLRAADRPRHLQVLALLNRRGL